MTRVFLLLFSSLIFSVIGCQRQVDIPIPPTNSGFIENSFGVTTARVFGIDFEIDGTSGGVNASTDTNVNFIEPKKSLAKKSFTIGKDCAIELTSINESTVNFRFQAQEFGVLRVGDRVIIDEKRNVIVNGEPRLPSEPSASVN
jgi:hypothetical protein